MTQQREAAQAKMSALATKWSHRIVSGVTPYLQQQYDLGADQLGVNRKVEGISQELQKITDGNQQALETAGKKLFDAIEAELKRLYPTATSTTVLFVGDRPFNHHGPLDLRLSVTF